MELEYKKTFKTVHTRDFFRGRSFRYGGKWQSDVHYCNDAYLTDFIVYNQVLLVCKKSHKSDLDNEPSDFITDSSGNVIGITSDYWEFVLAGTKGDIGQMCDIRVGTVTRLPIGSMPTVSIEEDVSGDFYRINFGIPEYDISSEALANLKVELKSYIDGKFSEIQSSLETWKMSVQTNLNNMQNNIDEFETTVNDSIDDIQNNIDEFETTVNDRLDDMQDAINQFKTDVEDCVTENERVIANALVRHEQKLEE